jgi:endonuclease VIII-like 1
MPELAELRLTASYINKVSKGLTFNKIAKNPIHKGIEVVSPFETFKISAESRGKELLLYLNDSKVTFPIRMNMGMAGHFQITETGKESTHAHLKFYSDNGKTLSFVDVRRFGKWKPDNEWSDNRGPDPTLEFNKFVLNITDNLNKSEFSKPIHLVLMNQKYFNGIGNYLRAEILYRIPLANPFLSAREIITQYPVILNLCKDIPTLAYIRGGGSIRDWKNPFGEDSLHTSFFKCYSNHLMSNIVDKNNRRFWYNPKWDNQIKQTI